MEEDSGPDKVVIVRTILYKNIRVCPPAEVKAGHLTPNWGTLIVNRIIKMGGVNEENCGVFVEDHKKVSE